MTAEEWRPVLGYVGHYEVSNLGRVRSLDRLDRRGHRLSGQMRKPVVNRYAYVMLCVDDQRKLARVHTLVLEAFVSPRPDGLEACHGDGDPLNNRLSNLRWDTRSANEFDKIKHGNHNKARRTHCPQGHALVAPNLRRGPGRACLACGRGRDWARYREVPFTKDIGDRFHAEITATTEEAA